VRRSGRPQDLQDATLQPALLPTGAFDSVQTSLPDPLEYAVANYLPPRKDSGAKGWITKVAYPVRLLFALVVILLIKPLTALVVAVMLRQPLHSALVVAIGLAQVGEFSFILIREAHALKVLPADVGHQLVAAAMISIMLNPFLFRHLPRIEQRLGKLQWLKSR
jgi:hypothetical protein